MSCLSFNGKPQEAATWRGRCRLRTLKIVGLGRHRELFYVRRRVLGNYATDALDLIVDF